MIKEIDQIMSELHKKLLNQPTGKEWVYSNMLNELKIERV